MFKLLLIDDFQTHMGAWCLSGIHSHNCVFTLWHFRVWIIYLSTLQQLYFIFIFSIIDMWKPSHNLNVKNIMHNTVSPLEHCYGSEYCYANGQSSI